MMYCLRSYLPLLLLPLPLSLSPVHLIIFIALTYFLNRPCIYCSLLLVILFATSCHWSNRCFISLSSSGGQYGEDPTASSIASWFIPRLYTTPPTTSFNNNGQADDISSDMGAFLADVANSTATALSQALKDSASNLVDGARSKLITNSPGGPASLPVDAGVGTQWLRQLLGRSEWTLPYVEVKIAL
ncbi:uncharacterized protein PV06_09026 [Exophiala oligosperma]|uniref:Uncharacterized protein n=1 Tax=Exophiala oligosperma TaxID=215243 RepID=A0A0D2D9U6_9EURO|nr:uncharacterized protein PV06_09026 [Exophiala oligosperma]KIW39235.1 hypothetical protein PV06_09026 [Exophiala oligosperma]